MQIKLVSVLNSVLLSIKSMCYFNPSASPVVLNLLLIGICLFAYCFLFYFICKITLNNSNFQILMLFFSAILHFVVTSDWRCKDTTFPFPTYAICAICVDSGNKVRKISWNHSEEYLRRIRNYLRKIAQYLRRIRNYLRKIAEYLRRINQEDKCR